MDNSSVATKKSLLRLHYKQNRQQISQAQALLASIQIIPLFLKILGNLQKPSLVIAGYYPINHEFDALPLLDELRLLGHKITLPSIKSGQILFKNWQKGEVLEETSNIPEPLESSETLTPDIIICPLLACDRSGHRLGYGKGYYDRTIQQYRLLCKILCIGVCYSSQISSEQIPVTTHDQRLDFIVTELEVIKCDLT